MKSSVFELNWERDTSGLIGWEGLYFHEVSMQDPFESEIVLPLIDSTWMLSPLLNKYRIIFQVIEAINNNAAKSDTMAFFLLSKSSKNSLFFF